MYQVGLVMITDNILDDYESLAGAFSKDEAGAESGVPHIIVIISTAFRLGGRFFSCQR